MLLLLARHADAGVSDRSRWPDDGDRPLTDLGRATQRAMGLSLIGAGFSPAAVLSSSILRARQTAEVIHEVCRVATPVVFSDALIKPSDLDAIAPEVAPFTDAPVVALVGHSPSMEEITSLLLVGSRDGLRTQFSKSAVMVIRTDGIAPGAGELVAFLQP